MTPDQIRQIAEEYAVFLGNTTPCVSEDYENALGILHFLAERYCLVEKQSGRDV